MNLLYLPKDEVILLLYMFHRIQKNGGEVVQISWCLALIELSKFIDLVPERPFLPFPSLPCVSGLSFLLWKREGMKFSSLPSLPFQFYHFFLYNYLFNFRMGLFSFCKHLYLSFVDDWLIEAINKSTIFFLLLYNSITMGYTFTIQRLTIFHKKYYY